MPTTHTSSARSKITETVKAFLRFPLSFVRKTHSPPTALTPVPGPALDVPRPILYRAAVQTSMAAAPAPHQFSAPQNSSHTSSPASGTPPAQSIVLDNAPAVPGSPQYTERRNRQREENQRLQEPEESTLAPLLSVEDMALDFVWIADGSYVGRKSDPMFCLSYSDFAGLTAASWSVENVDGRNRRTPHATLWKGHHQRQTVHTRTFGPGQGVICKDPIGRLALNSWRPIIRRPSNGDVTPFLEHVSYLLPNPADAKTFLDWLAHLEQHPGELPHHGWLHVAKHTGTGRNWLASLLARVWIGYVAPNLDLSGLLDSSFNGQLGGRVLAIVDEIQEGARDNAYKHHNKLNQLVNAEYRDVNPKYGKQYREFNACRWLVFSNFLNALPMTDTDRRWYVVRHEAEPRDPAVYIMLYAKLRDPEFVNAVGCFLRQRDISGFNPGARPPMNSAKRAALQASKSDLQLNAEHLVASWPADVITNADAAFALSDGSQNKAFPEMRAALEALGATSLGKTTLSIGGSTTRGWILRNSERWLSAGPKELAREASRARQSIGGHTTALEVLHRAGQDQQAAGPRN